MDSLKDFDKAQQALKAGNKMKVFNWNKAAQIIKDNNPKYATAGLSSDLEWTSGTIYEHGKYSTSGYTYLASNWATPVLILENNEEIDCWCYQEDTNWDANTTWPESALKILNG